MHPKHPTIPFATSVIVSNGEIKISPGTPRLLPAKYDAPPVPMDRPITKISCVLLPELSKYS